MKVLFLIILCVALIAAVPFEKKTEVFQIGGGRIINGSPAAEGQFPWQVAIQLEVDSYTYFCGGSLISDQWILTAAHCVAIKPDPANFKVFAGIVQLGDATNPLTVAQAIPHSEYSDWTIQNDIALLQLAVPVELSDMIKPIALSVEVLAEDTPVTVSGWGTASDSASELSPNLNFIDLVTITNTECYTFYVDGFIANGMVCATAAAGDAAKSTCNGDSGGPLIVNPNSNPIQVGVVSFVSGGGCESGYPSGYTRVAYYRDWIKEISGI